MTTTRYGDASQPSTEKLIFTSIRPLIRDALGTVCRTWRHSIPVALLIVTAGCVGTLRTEKSFYPTSQPHGYALLSGRNDSSRAVIDYVWNIVVSQDVDGTRKKLGLLQVGEPRPPWVSVAPQNSLQFLVAAPPGRATFYFAEEMNQVSVDIHEDLTTRVTMVLSGKVDTKLSTKYNVHFEVDDPMEK